MLRAFQYDPEVHLVLQSEPEFLGWVRRRFPGKADNFFVYFHRLENTFILAGWTHRKGGRMVDLIYLGPTPEFDRQDRLALELLIAPPEEMVITQKRIAAEMDADERADARQMQGDAEELVDLKRSIVARMPWLHDHPLWADTRKDI